MPALAMEIIEFINGLTIQQGDRVGEPFKLLGWEKHLDQCHCSLSIAGTKCRTG